MSARDLALAIRRLVDSPWACRSLAAGDEYALSGLQLASEERDLLIRDLTTSVDEMAMKIAVACHDPTMRDATDAGLFFEAARRALNELDREQAAEFQAFLVSLARRDVGD